MDKKETPAEEFIRQRRMKYSELYPTNFHFFLNLISSADDNWDENGLMICTYNERESENNLTEEGWKSAKNLVRCPTSWPMPDSRSPLFNIPDNADDSWLHEIGMFIHYLEKWEVEHVETWITTAVRLNGSGLEYQKDSIDRNLKGFHAVREAIDENKVRERIRLIHTERHMPKVERKPIVEVGATVRFFTGVDTAIVLEKFTTPSSRYRGDGGMCLVRLDQKINGAAIHLAENLIATEFPKEAEGPEKKDG